MVIQIHLPLQLHRQLPGIMSPFYTNTSKVGRDNGGYNVKLSYFHNYCNCNNNNNNNNTNIVTTTNANRRFVISHKNDKHCI